MLPCIERVSSDCSPSTRYTVESSPSGLGHKDPGEEFRANDLFPGESACLTKIEPVEGSVIGFKT
eukprot:12037725-Heterocapsa_arctica.AAC.1